MSDAATLLTPETSGLLVIDMQARLLPALPDAAALLDSVGLLVRVARLVGVPTAVTEHCADRIGRTADTLLAELGHAVFVDKHHFAATRAPGFAAVMQAWAQRTTVVAGAEAHVCVGQTALALRAAGHRVAVAVDAIGARHPEDRAVALARMQAAGVTPVTVEMLATEWLADADDPRFREMLGWIKYRHGRRPI
ncbi:MAG: isochorismatase family protein [Alphaproteobacteria bacterium]